MRINNAVAKEYLELMSMKPKKRTTIQNKRMYEIWHALKATGVGIHTVGEYVYNVFKRKAFKGRKAAVVVVMDVKPVAAKKAA